MKLLRARLLNCSTKGLLVNVSKSSSPTSLAAFSTFLKYASLAASITCCIASLLALL